MTRPRGAPLRVLMVSQPTDGGVGAFVSSLSSYALERGLAVALACPPSDLARDLSERGVQWEKLCLSRGVDRKDLTLIRALRARMTDCDVLHLHSSKAGALGRIAARALLGHSRPSIMFTPHGWSWHAGGAHTRQLYVEVERALARSADVTVPVSLSEAAEGRRVLGARAGEMRTILEWSRRPRFHALRASGRARRLSSARRCWEV